MSSHQPLRITLVQSYIQWQDKLANLEHYKASLNGLSDTDLIVLPEMFSTGFSMQPERFAETIDGDTVQWMQLLARQKNAVITGSLIIEEDGHFYNRLIWMKPDGSLTHYDKRHLFSFADEHNHYSAGQTRLVEHLNGWRICPLICYDLRFPVWCRNQNLSGDSEDNVFDLMLFVANWPEARRSAWISLLEARAHENQCYVAGVNRIGKDGNGINHSGDSRLISPKGELISNIESNTEQVSTFAISMDDLNQYRGKFTAWKDKDRFLLQSEN